ncbi:F0F1 ATP synthase subunit alpha [Salsipaludibacter albus]|uniref:F0F1 ATP synthase subunit alpha n=1 Tax=Salsipaludibacter albus TaxID=2849650 RepID=UPI001EE49EA2|nr:F0F1 ATP synthase subunit alpha [Salsipaludibacter albus]MBY5163358.1 F0F1 ATP synthase subunit alpha [Salsipaludibacter albus]
MSDLTIRPEDVTASLKSMLEGYTPTTAAEQVGRVTQTGDGIAEIVGLPGTMANELLDFGDGVMGMAMNLNEGSIGAAVFAESSRVEEGMTVRRTERVLSVQVGDAMLGRVLDPLGRPIDGKGPLDQSGIDGYRSLEVQAAGVTERQEVREPLQTGIKVIDVMTPIGRGQRELIIGDRQTGKTAIAIDTIINQKQYWGTEQAVKCIYVAIGQKGSTVASVVETLERHGAMEYTTVVNAPASSPAPFQYIAPYAGCAIGANWMEKGEHALIIYDDLTKQADAYRQLSLLLRRPPGREAYPGDVFYLHSRLLERAAKLSEELGGGSLTALPIVETKANDVSAFIPTNVISITDGQIFLETDLFFQGVRPAMNAGVSVSRVGGSAQVPGLRSVSGTVRIDLAQYRELEAFAQFGSDLDQASQRQIARGERVVEVLKQPQYEPLPVRLQILSVYAVTSGAMDDIPVVDVARFEDEIHEHFTTSESDLLAELVTTKVSGDIAERLDAAIADFKDTFEPSADVSEPTEERNEGWDVMSAGDDQDDDDQSDDGDADDQG